MRSAGRLAVSGAVCAFTLAGCSGEDCKTLCDRVRRCEAEVAQALTDRQPGKSRFMKHVRRKLPSRIAKRLVASCGERCPSLLKDSKWRQRLKRCAAQTQCRPFARCIAPALEP